MRRGDREVNDRKGIEEILLRCKTCHLAMADGGSPYVVPLSFGYRFPADDTLEMYFHSAYEGKKIDLLRKNNRVCFEVSDEGEPVHAENPCNSGYYYSSVIGYGEALFITDTVAKCDGLSVIFRCQTGRDIVFNESQAETVCVYKIVSKDFIGKKKPKP